MRLTYNYKNHKTMNFDNIKIIIRVGHVDLVQLRIPQPHIPLRLTLSDAQVK